MRRLTLLKILFASLIVLIMKLSTFGQAPSKEVQSIEQQLKLDDEQINEFRAVNVAFNTTVTKIKLDYADDRELQRQLTQRMESQRNAMMKEVLSASQFEKYLQDLDEKSKNKRGRH